jgi:hypothetical protein
MLKSILVLPFFSAMVMTMRSPFSEADARASSKTLPAASLFVPRPVPLSPFEQRKYFVSLKPTMISSCERGFLPQNQGCDCSPSTCLSQINVCAISSCTFHDTATRRLSFVAMSEDDMSVDETKDDAYDEEQEGEEEMKADTQEGAFKVDEQEEDDDDSYIIEDADDTCYDNEPEGPPYASQQEIEDNLLRINGNLSSSLGITLKYASISVQDLFLPFKQDSVNKTISLSKFHPLFVQANEDVGEDEFFPNMEKILVRPSMKRLMKRFTWNRTKMREKALRAKKWVLIGSPGTGKSLLFFLAAVWKASKGKQPIVYLRKARKEQISIFYMFSNGPNKVGMYFKRQSKKEYDRSKTMATLQQVYFPLIDAIDEHLSSKPEPLWFVDGPKHDDKDNALDDRCDYSCSSGGYPRLKNEEQGKVLIWVLDRWSKKEIISALCLIYEQEKTKAEEIYYVTGGCMRDAARAVREGVARVKTELISATDAIKHDDMVLVSTDTVNPNLSNNRVRMMSVADKKSDDMTDSGNVIHKVDSRYVIERFRFRAGLKRLRLLFVEAKVTYNDANIAAGFYEAYWHKWFETTTPLELMTFFNDMAGEKPLEEENQYWVPKPGFPHIDAALVRNDTLYAFQYTTGMSTTKSRRTFDMHSFMSDFVAPLRKKLDGIKKVSVAFVTNRKDFKEPKLNRDNKQKKGPGGKEVPQTFGVTCPKDVMYCMVDGVEINFITNIVYADVRSDRIPNFPCLDDNFGM